MKALKETTLQTFFEVAKMQGVKKGIHFDLTSAQDKENPNCIVFFNGSLIYLKDLFNYPSDPDFDELGSLEITDGFIDEAPQVTEKAKNIVRSRMRYQLDQNNLIPKLLMCGNPSKNWAYRDFYMPAKKGELRKDRMFIQALPGDNPYLPKSYIDSLRGLDKNSRERLLEGNWEYDDDPTSLIDYEKILDCFTNDFEGLNGEKFITCDVARFGSDSTIIALWNGFRVKMQRFKGLSVVEVAQRIRDLASANGIPTSRIVADEDGVGGGVVDILKCRGFVNNSTALPNPLKPRDDKGTVKAENYVNLKSQCYYRLAERINASGLYIETDSIEMRADVIQELEQVKQHNMDKDGKKAVMPKDKVKELIGRSPDYSDTLMMRELFELQPKRSWIAV